MLWSERYTVCYNVVSDLFNYHTVLRQVAHLLWSESYTVCYNVVSDLLNYHTVLRQVAHLLWSERYCMLQCSFRLIKLSHSLTSGGTFFVV